jgi:radical SAM protein
VLTSDPNARYRYAQAPLRVYWEITRACDLTCLHCRAEAQPLADPDELSTAEGFALIDQVSRFGPTPPRLVLTGGDPLKREDLFELIAYAGARGMGVSVAPSATPLLTAEALRRLKDAGVEAISLSLDAADAATHDAIRGIPGTFARTCDAARVAAAVKLPFQVNTLVCARTVDQLPALLDLVQALGAPRWSLFFLVSVGRGELLDPISAERAEAVLHGLAARRGQAMARGLVITTTEAPQLRRVVAQLGEADGGRKVAGDGGAVKVDGTNRTNGTNGVLAPAIDTSHKSHLSHPSSSLQSPTGNGVLFISHRGDICPSGFLELAAGNIRRDDLAAVYREAPLFTALRDPDAFGGRCGICPFRWPCGGSRARAFADTGDILGEDPLCTWQPEVVPDRS